MDAETAADSIISDSLRTLCAGTPQKEAKPLGTQWLRVVNTLGVAREDLTEISVAADRGTRSVRLFDADGKAVACQISPTRKYGAAQSGSNRAGSRTLGPGESINAANVVFRASVPAMGYANYRVEPVYDDIASPPDRGVVTVRTESSGNVVMESDLYRIILDPKRGGAFSSLFAKSLNKEFCDPFAQRHFNEYAGYFIEEKKWQSSVDQPARISILENGPLRGRVRIPARSGRAHFRRLITIAAGQRRIDFEVRFTFDQDTWIGDPWDIKPEDRRSEPRRSQNDGRWKLQAFFPVSLRNHAIYKNAAYDVCRSRNSDTFFQGWDEIKHNIIVNWVDLLDEQAKTRPRDIFRPYHCVYPWPRASLGVSTGLGMGGWILVG